MEETTDNTDHIGKRVEVFWPDDEEFYAGRVTNKRKLATARGKKGKKKRPGYEYLIEYDDGEEEWVDLDSDDSNIKFIDKDSCSPQKRQEQRNKLTVEVARLKINCRILVWWPLEKEWFLATLDEIREEAKQPHHVHYDDGDEEWTNLNYRKFKFEDNKKEEESSSSGTGEISASPVDRKAAFQSKNNRETTNSNPNELQVTCKICNKQAKKPRAASCHHIFCKVCIKASSRRIGKKCPVCNVCIKSKIEKVNFSLDSFKAVEALSMQTSEVVLSFDTASAASLEMDKAKTKIMPFQIVEACKSLQYDDRLHGGYYWRFRGCKQMMLKAGKGVKEVARIEEVSLETSKTESKARKTIQIRERKNGEVFKEFQTSKEAAQFISYQHSFNCSTSNICRWCREESFELGFHWQYRS